MVLFLECSSVFFFFILTVYLLTNDVLNFQNTIKKPPYIFRTNRMHFIRSIIHFIFPQILNNAL